MTGKFTEEQLQNLDQEMLISLYMKLQEQNEAMMKRLDLLTEQITIMNQRTCGRKPEEKFIPVGEYSQARQIEENGKNVIVFNEAEAECITLFAEPSEDEILPFCNRKRKDEKEKGVKGLPVVIEEHDFTEEQLKDVFGDRNYKRLSDEVCKRLIYTPETKQVVEHHIAVYTATDSQNTVKAQHPKDLIRGSIVTPSLAAAIFNGKYLNALSLYRLEQEFKRDGLNLSRQAMANWIVKLAEEYLSLFYDELHKELYKSHILHADEIPVKVKKDGSKTGSKSYMWLYRTGGYNAKKPVVLYQYQSTRVKDHPREFLKGFDGLLVKDGYQVYHSLGKEQYNLRAADCWLEARSELEKIVKTCREWDGERRVVASEILSRIQSIFTLDNLFSEESNKERERRRQESVKPLVDALFLFLKENENDVPPETDIGQAIQYCLSRENYFRAFLNDGDIPLDRHAEKTIRKFGLGKREWVLLDSVNGAKASAIIYSIAATALANHVRTYHYFEFLLTEMMNHTDDTDTDFLKDLLPWSPKIPNSCKFTD